ncbi:MAG: M16 family metallopeptidase [Bradymonadaceae bacterium]
MRATRRHIAALAILVSLSPACASSSGSTETASDQTPEEREETIDAPTTASYIPALRDLELSESKPTVEKIGSREEIDAYRVGDLRVLHKKTPANSVVAAKLYFEGGVANLGDKRAGIEKLALRVAVDGGTKSTPKDEFNAALASMGSSIDSFAGRDYSGYSLRCVKSHFDETWDLFVESVVEPAFPESEIKLKRQKQLAEIRKIRENPNRLVAYMARKAIAEGHPYEHFQLGTSETLPTFDRTALRAYHHWLVNPERMLLVVVGDVSSDELIEKVSSTLGRLPSKEWKPADLPPLEASSPSVKGVEKKLPTNYILGKFPAPAPGSSDYYATLVGLEYLKDRLFQEIRTQRSLTYAVSAGLGAHRANSGYLYVSAKKPNETLKAMIDQIESLRQSGPSKAGLERTRNVFITEHYLGLQTNASQASALADAELIHGDWRAFTRFADRVEAVTPEQVRSAIKSYLQNYQFAVVGRPDKLDLGTVGL